MSNLHPRREYPSSILNVRYPFVIPAGSRAVRAATMQAGPVIANWIQTGPAAIEPLPRAPKSAPAKAAPAAK